MNKNKLILWDVGAVLLELDYNGLFDAGAKITGQSREQFKESYTGSKLEPKVLSGEISHEEFLQRLRGLLKDKSLTEPQLEIFFRNAWGSQINETVELKKKVHEAGYTVGLFSNINQFAIQILSKEFPDMFKTFGGPKIYSYQVGATKEKPDMYEKVQSLGFEKPIYIDDNATYVQKGAEFGWKGILFTPYIDKAEVIRAEKGQDIKKTNSQIKIAGSVKGLVSCLGECGVKIS